MNNTLLRSILAGLLLGAAFFIMPFFLIRLTVFLLIISALFRLFGGGRFRRRGWRQGWGYGYIPAFTDRIRQMSHEEYEQFKQRYTPGGRRDYQKPTSPENPAGGTPTNV